MLFQIDFKTGKPVYLQLVDQVRYAAASGALRLGEFELPNELRRCGDGLLAKLMNVQLASSSCADRNRKYFRLEASAMTDRAGRAIHEGPNPASGQFALRLQIKAL